jgi:uncharacterized protein YeaO (DUF488 family)
MPGEGLRLGTVRRPPRGVPRREYARRDYYDVWLPELAPAAATITLARSGEATDWQRFVRRYRREMGTPACSHLLDFLAALSHHSAFSVGCYCADETRCHRVLLRAMLTERGAVLA